MQAKAGPIIAPGKDALQRVREPEVKWVASVAKQAA